MTHIDLKINNSEPFEMNLHFNNVFSNAIKDGIHVFKELRIMSQQEYGWLDQANENILAELMSWKGK